MNLTVNRPDASDRDDATDDDRTATGEVSAPIPKARRRFDRLPRKPKVVIAALLIIAICGFGAASGYMTWQHRKADHNHQLTTEAAMSARQAVVNLMSLDFNKVKEDVQRIIDSSTGDFKKDFESQADDFVKRANDSKVTTTVSVNGTAVQSMSENSAIVLVAAQSRVTNAAGANSEQRNWRLCVTMTRDGGRLKMSKVEFAP